MTTATAVKEVKEPDVAPVDVYRYWRARLKGVTGSASNDLMIVTGHGDGIGDPQPGIWRMRDGSRGAPFVPVKIWLVDETTGQPVHKVAPGVPFRCAAQRGKSQDVLSHDETVRAWSYCMQHPVTIADRDAWMPTGRWPGDVDAPTKPDHVAMAMIGDNSGPAGVASDPYDAIKSEFDDYAATCAAFMGKAQSAGGLKTKAEADQASNMADNIGKVKGGIAKRADDKRKELVAPHLDAQEAINARYNPIVKTGDEIARSLRQLSASWVSAEQARLQAIATEEARKKADDENARRAAERQKLEAEAAEQAKRDAEQRASMASQLGLGEDAATAELADIAPEPVEIPDDLKPVEAVAPQVKIQVGGQRGAKRSLKKEKIAVIADYAKALAFFANNADVVELIGVLAQRAVKAGVSVPGVTIEDKVKL